MAAAVKSAPHVLSLESTPWQLPEATLLQLNWEVLDEPALELTPPSLHPSIPPFVSVFCGRYNDTPVGPFTLAQMRLVVRAGIRPRGLCLGAVCDSAAATEALRSMWGYPVVHGQVTLAVRHDRVVCNAAVDGREVMEAGIGDPEAIGGSDLMAFDNLHVIRSGDNEEGLIVQINPEYAIHTADRGRPILRLPDPNALGMNGLIRLTAPMTGFTFRADTDLTPVRFVMDPVIPAVQSTRRLDLAGK
jgi:Acetoacetate decarboxylase (ADC)